MSVFDEVAQMWHPDTLENRAIISSDEWKVMCAIWGPPIQPLPAAVSVLHLPATNPHEEGANAQNGPSNPYARRFEGRKRFACS